MAEVKHTVSRKDHNPRHDKSRWVNREELDKKKADAALWRKEQYDKECAERYARAHKTEAVQQYMKTMSVPQFPSVMSADASASDDASHLSLAAPDPKKAESAPGPTEPVAPATEPAKVVPGQAAPAESKPATSKIQEPNVDTSSQ